MLAKRAVKNKASKASDMSLAARCYLLDLPAELRLCIIELALGTNPVQVGLIYEPTDAKVLTQPPISRTCRQLRKEALPVFYSRRMFKWLDLDDRAQLGHLKSWLTASCEHTNFIQALKMVFCDVHHTTFKVEAKRRKDVNVDIYVTEKRHVRNSRRIRNTPLECCPTFKRFKEVEYQLRDLFSNAGLHGLSAAEYISAADLLFTGHSYFACT